MRVILLCFESCQKTDTVLTGPMSTSKGRQVLVDPQAVQTWKGSPEKIVLSLDEGIHRFKEN